MGSKSMQIDVRPTAEGTFDEIVAKNAEMVHLEMLSPESLYIGIYGGGDRMVQVWVNAVAALSVEHSAEGVEAGPYPVAEAYTRKPTEQAIVETLTEDQLTRLREHALCLACKDGNAFDGLIDQYLPDAYDNLWRNGRVGERDDLPMLYPASASDHWHAFLTPEHPQYADMSDSRRADLIIAFAEWNKAAV